MAEDALRQSDLCICMGTSLRIRPASELPLLTVKNGGKLVLLNLQKTPKDRHAYLRIQTPVDNVLRGVMAALDLPIPSFERSLSLVLVARRYVGDEALENSTAVAQITEAKSSAYRVKEEAKEGGHARQQECTSSAACREGGSGGEERVPGGVQKEDGGEENVLWQMGLLSPVGRDCALPLIDRVVWKCASSAGVEDGKELGQAMGLESSSLSGVVAAARTRGGGPGDLSAEIFFVETCSFPSKTVEVRLSARMPMRPRIEDRG